MDWISQLNYLDFILLMILGTSVVASVVRGFTREVAGLIALILGVLLGLWFHGAVANFVLQYVSAPEVAKMIGFGVIFLGVIVIGGFIGSVASKVLQVTGLSLLDRTAGAAFGLLKGGLFGAIIIFALLAFSPGGPPHDVRTSKVAPYVLWSARLLATLAPAEVKNAVVRNAEVIQETWRGRIPDLPIPATPVEEDAQEVVPKKVRPTGKASPAPR